jgi:hypothetical protein
MPSSCCAPVMPCTEGFRFILSHLVYTVRPSLIQTYHAVLRPCRSECEFSRQRHSTAWARYGMCELDFIHRFACLPTHAARLIPRHTYKISALKEFPRQLVSRICTENTNVNISPSSLHYFCMSAILSQCRYKMAVLCKSVSHGISLLYSPLLLCQVQTLKANSHIPCRSHAAPIPFPCHAV